MLIWLASFPRSGNTLVRLVLEREFGLHTCSLYPEADDAGSVGISDLVAAASVEAVCQVIESDPEVHFVKTHETATKDASPAVYVVRDGRDALVSFAHYLIDFVIGIDERNPEIQFWQTLQELIASTDRFGGWSQNVMSWLNRPQTFVVKYEELILDPKQVTANIVDALGLDVSTGSLELIPSFEQLKQQAPRFYRRGNSGAWKDEMDVVLQDLFWREHGETMDLLGYERASG
jgi:hypothetical protein